MMRPGALHRSAPWHGHPDASGALLVDSVTNNPALGIRLAAPVRTGHRYHFAGHGAFVWSGHLAREADGVWRGEISNCWGWRNGLTAVPEGRRLALTGTLGPTPEALWLPFVDEGVPEDAGPVTPARPGGSTPGGVGLRDE